MRPAVAFACLLPLLALSACESLGLEEETPQKPAAAAMSARPAATAAQAMAQGATQSPRMAQRPSGAESWVVKDPPVIPPDRDYPAQVNTPPVGWLPDQTKEVLAARQAGTTLPRAQARPDAPAQRSGASRANPMAPAAPTAAAPAPAAMPAPAMAAPKMEEAKPAMAMAAPLKPETGVWRAHLASHRTEMAAINDWEERLKANAGAYAELEPDIVWVEVPNRGAFARLTFGHFETQKEADAACAKLRGPGRYCAPVKD